MTNVTLEILKSNYSSINHGSGHKAGGRPADCFRIGVYRPHSCHEA